MAWSRIALATSSLVVTDCAWASGTLASAATGNSPPTRSAAVTAISRRRIAGGLLRTGDGDAHRGGVRPSRAGHGEDGGVGTVGAIRVLGIGHGRARSVVEVPAVVGLVA